MSSIASGRVSGTLASMLSEEACPKSPLASAVFVRHTFIDLEDDDLEHDNRRSSSEPPSRRHRDKVIGRCPESPFLTYGSSSSTSSGSPRETASDFASEERSHQGSAESTPCGPGLNPNAPVWSPASVFASPGKELPPPFVPGSPIAAMSPLNLPDAPAPVFYQMPQNQAFCEQAPPPPPPLNGPGTCGGYQPIASQSRLNANAKAWQPGAPMTMAGAADANAMMPIVPPPPPAPAEGELASMPNVFRKQFEAMLDSTKQALAGHAKVVGVEIFESADQWGAACGMSIVAYANREEHDGRFKTAKELDETNIGEIMELASSTLLKGAENSKSVYVMGFKAKPFSYAGNGFTGMLGGMNDSTKACWELFSKGCCRRDWECRWQHPACQLPIQMEVRASTD